MSIIKDESLYKSGMDKISWVRSYMPVLNLIEKEFSQIRVFDGLRISMSIHLEAKTAYLAMVLRSAGAQVYVTGCNPLSTQDDVAAALVYQGFEVFAVHGADNDTYYEHLELALSQKPHLIIDDGGDFIQLLHGGCRALGEFLIGGCEETTTGIRRLRARQDAGELLYPMMAVNDADCKHLFDNRYGTGQSTIDAVMHTTNLLIAGKTVVVAGYGWCGRGVAMRARGMGARVIVCETDPVRAVEAVMDGCGVMPMADAAPIGDIFITTTGCRDIIRREHLVTMKDGAILANSGHFDVEIDKKALESISSSSVERKPGITGYILPDGRTLNLMAEGRLVNLAAGNGHPAEIMDMSFAIQARALEYLALHGRAMSPALYSVPHEIDLRVAADKLAALGVGIDVPTREQVNYLTQFK